MTRVSDCHYIFDINLKGHVLMNLRCCGICKQQQ